MPSSPPWTNTLSLHDALPISVPGGEHLDDAPAERLRDRSVDPASVLIGAQHLPQRRRPTQIRQAGHHPRSEEHTSELQSRGHIVCRPLLEKKQHATTTKL